MDEWLHEIAEYIALAIGVIAILIVAYGSVEAVVGVFRLALTRAGNAEKRLAWMHYAQWLVAALTFQLAADIVSTTVAPSWDQIGRVAAIAAIRTLLTFFLDRDMKDVREVQHARDEEAHILKRSAGASPLEG